MSNGHFFAQLPARQRESLELYLQHGIGPGGFLTAVLCNDLVNTWIHADDVNRAALPVYVGWLVYEAPAESWGSRARVRDWIDRFVTAR